MTTSRMDNAFLADDFRAELDQDMRRHGLNPSQLLIVDSIKEFCATHGDPHWEDREDRQGKTIHVFNPPMILIKRRFTGEDQYQTFRTLGRLGFSLERIGELESPLLFLRQLLHHEIAHVLFREQLARLNKVECERECDQWSLEQIGYI